MKDIALSNEMANATERASIRSKYILSSVLDLNANVPNTKTFKFSVSKYIFFSGYNSCK
jgi:hypothetical protein